MEHPRPFPALRVSAFACGAALACAGACGGGGRSGRSGLDMAVTGLVVPATAAAGDTIQVSATVENRGTIPASPAVAVVLAVVPQVFATDNLLTLALPAFILDPGRTIPMQTSVQLPAN